MAHEGYIAMLSGVIIFVVMQALIILNGFDNPVHIPAPGIPTQP